MYPLESRQRRLRGAPPWSLVFAFVCGCSIVGCSETSEPVLDPFPEAVTELSESDLTAAGIPVVASLGTAAVRVSSVIEYARCQGSLAWDDVLAIDNLVPADDGAGWETNVPEGEGQRRILGWALYELPGSAASHLARLENDFAFGDGSARFFFALANARSRSWEIGGRLDDGSDESQRFQPDGQIDDGSGRNWARDFSPSQDYVFPDGSSYLLLAIGHPGNSQVDGITCRMEDWSWWRILDSVSDEFGEGVNGSAIYLSDTFSYFDQDHRFEQRFETSGSSDDGLVLFAQPMNILLGGWGQDRVTNLGVVDGSDFNIWLHGYFRPGEMNGWEHPFALGIRTGAGNDHVLGAPLVDSDGDGEANGIIAILIGLRKEPVSNATVGLYLDDIVIGSTETNRRGEFRFSDLDAGEYRLEIEQTANYGGILDYYLSVYAEGGGLHYKVTYTE